MQTRISPWSLLPLALISVVLAEKPAANPAPPNPAAAAQIQQLVRTDPSEAQDALNSIRAKLKSRGDAAVGDLKNTYFKQLIAAQRADDAALLAWELILAQPSKASQVTVAQQVRVRAALAAGKPQEALAQAKSLFNVTTMAATAEAVLLVQECLRAAYPDDPAILAKFKQEQMDGAAATDSLAKTGRRSTVLDGIRVDAAPYLETIKGLTGEGYGIWAARGNLFLLADKIAEAKAAFEEAYSLASEKQLAEASENLARCMRAEDGTIGRANAWVLSIRPKDEPTK